MQRRTVLAAALFSLALSTGCDGNDANSPAETSTGTEPGSTGNTPASSTSSSGGEGSTSTAMPTTTPDDDSSSGGPAGSSSFSGDAETSTGTSGPASGATVAGNITRSVGIAGDNDGIGDVYLGLLVECADGADSVADIVVMGADLSQPGSLAAFSQANLPDGTYYLTGFFDDNQNADPLDPRPDLNDLATVENFGPACAEVVIAGSDVGSVVVTLNFVVPF